MNQRQYVIYVKKNNKNDTYKNVFYYCLNCKKNLCPLCRDRHDRNHNIIEYEQKNFICPEHEDYYSLYCKACKKIYVLVAKMSIQNVKLNLQINYYQKKKIWKIE